MPDLSGFSESQVCKKCNLHISEGHAYELGDDRWHIHCFKCSKCDNSLGCNSNFLILGDGNLICSSCSYNCKQCGKKIDDLAILTGDQAYCSSCFKCRVCKSKIEDLRYARTSKGLFCMSCHEKLIAKKRKYDLKRKQMAHLESSSKPQQASPGSVDSPSTQGTPGHFSDIYLNYQNSSSVNSFKDKALPNPNAASSVRASHVSSTDSPDVHTSSRPSPVSSELYRSASSQHQQHDSGSLKDEIEEVNDSDDELNARRAAKQTPDAKHLESSSGDNILELIESFSGPNTPLTEETDITKVAPVASSGTNSSRPTALNHKLGDSSKAQLSPNNDEGTSHYTTPRTDSLPITQNELGSAPRLEPDDRSSQRELLLLSPSQYHDNRFHNTSGPSQESLSTNGDDITRRSAASSPMAKVNRQARVVETNDEISGSDIGSSYNAYENSIITTPKKPSTGTPNKIMASPPPRSALPNVPATPKRSAPAVDPFEPKGLGLENVELQKSSKVVHPATPAVTNLEDKIDENWENELGTPQSFGRRNTFKGPKFLKHKRSTSSGSGSSKFGNLFKGREEQPSSHSRHVSEGSINHHSAIATSPLPLTSPMKHGGFGGHNRSTSDTQYFMNADLQSERQRLDKDMRNLRVEISSLEGRKQTLFSEIVKLSADKTKLSDTIGILREKIEQEQGTHEQILQDIHDLVAEKRRLAEENRDLKDTNSRLKREAKHSNESTTSSTTPTHLAVEAPDGSISSVNLAYDGVDDAGETQKATRLRFWRRPKVSVASTTPQMGQGPQQMQPSTSVNKITPSVSGPQHQNNHSDSNSSQHKVSQPYSSNAIQHPSQHAHNDHSSQESGPRKAFNTFMSKSRSTNILDSFVQATQQRPEENGDAPLLSTTIQKRATYENEKVPLIITKCIEEVEKRGLDMEGIYRISGGNTAITAILNAFSSLPANPQADKKHMFKLAEVMDGDIHAVTSALKRYLRKLPEPLIPFSLYDEYVKICQNDNDTQARCDELVSNVINKLPTANRHTLFLLSKHLDLVGYYNNVNRMTLKNLSVVLAPTIARDATGEREMADMAPRNDTTELLLSNFSKIFVNYEI